MKTIVQILILTLVQIKLQSQTVTTFDTQDFECQSPILMATAVEDYYVAVGTCFDRTNGALKANGSLVLIDELGEIVEEKTYVFDEDIFGSAAVHQLSDQSVVFVLGELSESSRKSHIFRRAKDGSEVMLTINGFSISQFQGDGADNLLAFGYGIEGYGIFRVGQNHEVLDSFVYPGEMGAIGASLDSDGTIYLYGPAILARLNQNFDVLWESQIDINFAEAVRSRLRRFEDHFLLIKAGTAGYVQNILKLDTLGQIIEEITTHPRMSFVQDAVINDDGSYLLWGIEETKYSASSIIQFYTADHQMVRSLNLGGHRAIHFSTSTDGTIVASGNSSDPDSILTIVKFDQTTPNKLLQLADCMKNVGPNPTSDFGLFQLSTEGETIAIFNIHGQLQLNTFVRNHLYNDIIKLPVHRLAPGRYFAKSNHCRAQSFIVQR